MAHKANPRALRQQMRARAHSRCEYCQHPDSHSSAPFVCEHILPRVHGTGDILPELVWACPACNSHKYAKTHAIDPQTRLRVPLFHPHRQGWSRYFAWSQDFLVVVGRTATGRAIIEALYLNRPELVNLRQALHAMHLHPPLPVL